MADKKSVGKGPSAHAVQTTNELLEKVFGTTFENINKNASTSVILKTLKQNDDLRRVKKKQLKKRKQVEKKKSEELSKSRLEAQVSLEKEISRSKQSAGSLELRSDEARRFVESKKERNKKLLELLTKKRSNLDQKIKKTFLEPVQTKTTNPTKKFRDFGSVKQNVTRNYTGLTPGLAPVGMDDDSESDSDVN